MTVVLKTDPILDPILALSLSKNIPDTTLKPRLPTKKKAEGLTTFCLPIWILSDLRSLLRRGKRRHRS